MYILLFIKIDSAIGQLVRVIRTRTHGHTARSTHRPTFIFKNKDTRLKTLFYDFPLSALSVYTAKVESSVDSCGLSRVLHCHGDDSKFSVAM
jgi:hypothetical protein